MSDFIGATLHGFREVRADFARVVAAEDAATRRAMVRTSAKLRSEIRKATPVRTTNLHRDPPPGDTRRHVHAVKPRKRGEEWTGKVSAMGGRRNLYVGKLEEQHPFVKPVEEAFRGEEIFREEWEAAFRL